MVNTLYNGVRLVAPTSKLTKEPTMRGHDRGRNRGKGKGKG